jgi:hypothetical protein
MDLGKLLSKKKVLEMLFGDSNFFLTFLVTIRKKFFEIRKWR